MCVLEVTMRSAIVHVNHWMPSFLYSKLYVRDKTFAKNHDQPIHMKTLPARRDRV